MAGLSKVVGQLRAERKLLANDLHKLDRAIGVLKTLDHTNRARPRGRSAGKVRRTMSAAARRRIAAAQRARWAKFKREKRDK